MTPEHRVKNEVRAYLGEHDILCFRVNVGTVKTWDGGYFHTGLPTGFPDLIAFGYGGEMAFIECKSAKGKLKPDQIAFKRAIEARGFRYIVARSVNDVLNIL